MVSNHYDVLPKIYILFFFFQSKNLPSAVQS